MHVLHNKVSNNQSAFEPRYCLVFYFIMASVFLLRESEWVSERERDFCFTLGRIAISISLYMTVFESNIGDKFSRCQLEGEMLGWVSSGALQVVKYLILLVTSADKLLQHTALQQGNETKSKSLSVGPPNILTNQLPVLTCSSLHQQRQKKVNIYHMTHYGLLFANICGILSCFMRKVTVFNFKQRSLWPAD